MGKWLNALVAAEKSKKRAAHPSAKSAKTPSDEVLSVLALPPRGVCAKILEREQASITPDGGPDDETNIVLSEWRRRLNTLDPSRPPASFPVPWWRGLIRDTELFLAMWGRQATYLGWTTLDLFGVHPKAPAARYSCMGLLLLIQGGRIVALTADSAIIERQSGARLTYRRRPPEPECVAVWELASR